MLLYDPPQKTARFKIDVSESGYFIALYFRRKTTFGWKWVELCMRNTIDECRERYEYIKDLPEYLP